MTRVPSDGAAAVGPGAGAVSAAGVLDPAMTGPRAALMSVRAISPKTASGV